MSVTFKIVFKKDNREPEIRRLTFKEEEANLDLLRSRAKKLFQLRDDQVWYFKWEDEEKDLITITEEYEFNDLLEAKSCDPVIRLHLFVEPPRVTVPVETAHAPRWNKHKHQHHQRTEEGARYGAICDITNTQLSIERDNWFHLPNSSTDFCVEEYERLEDGDLKRSLVKINTPSDLGSDQGRYELRRRCGRGKQGGRGRCPFFERVGEGSCMGWCDVTNAVLTPGCGWYHKRNENYDVVEPEFNKLPDSEKSLYVRVDKPEDLGPDQYRYCSFPAVMNPSCSRVVPEAAQSSAPAFESPSKPSKTMRVVSGPSIPHGTKVVPGARLIPIWEVQNTGEGDQAIWTEVRVKPQEGKNVLKVSEDGFEVPLLDAGAKGIVSVEFVVPVQEKSGEVEAEFVLVDGQGVSFGEPLLLKLFVEVKDQHSAPQQSLAPVANERDLVNLLRDMGFLDEALCTQVLRQNKGDANASALALLRLREE